ncbi:5-hydroxytryptamine receptor 3A-like [Alosa sapidissima]|uniref:5-hydroxytryptamine receptor 3A-like n=1 Tax=Alosa sapidissima TaxID=34773 RepID=UPI001C085ABA|nr:5-hydroxytryptamine receptor 3A-like [Alosa sapidissima]
MSVCYREVLLWMAALVHYLPGMHCDIPNSSADPSSLALSQWLSSFLDSEAAQLRPVRDWQRSVSVKVDLSIQSVLDVDEKNERLLLYVLYIQGWVNEHLRWDPSMFGGVQQVTVASERLWRPDVILFEIAGMEDYDRSPQVSISHDGWVEQYQPRLLESSCPLNLFHFPLDTHICNLTFISQAHTEGEVELYWGPGISGGQGDVSFSRGEWELTSLTVHTNPRRRKPNNRPSISAQVTVRRRPLLYVVMLLLPTSLLILLDLLSFLIPAYLKQRLSVTATIFTGHFIFLIAIFTLFPPFSIKLPLIEVYLFGSLGLLACSTMETAVVFQIANGKSEWFRKNIFPSLLLLSGRSHWETMIEPERGRSTGGAVDPVSTCHHGSPGPAVQLLRDLVRIRQDLLQIRREQTLLDLYREVGCSVDRGYLYLHCLVLLLGGAALLREWDKHV